MEHLGSVCRARASTAIWIVIMSRLAGITNVLAGTLYVSIAFVFYKSTPAVIPAPVWVINARPKGRPK
jgi:hypothetical protein